MTVLSTLNKQKQYLLNFLDLYVISSINFTKVLKYYLIFIGKFKTGQPTIRYIYDIVQNHLQDLAQQLV